LEEIHKGQCYEVIPGNYKEEFVLDFPAGTYMAEWLEPATGKILRTDKFTHNGGKYTLTTPPYPIDIALRIKK
jgi:hypothetical protein